MKFTTYSLIAVLSLPTIFVGSDSILSHDQNELYNAQEMITPAAGPRVEKGADVFVTVGFNYSENTQNGLAFAEDSQALAPSATVENGTFFAPKRAYDPGFTASLGINTMNDGWDVILTYELLHQNKKQTRQDHNVATGRVLNQLIGTTQLASPIESATGAWELSYDVLDGEIGRNFFLSQYFTMRPFIGIRSQWQDATFNVAYENSTEVQNVNQNATSFGVGIFSGSDVSYQFSRSWSLYGKSSLTLLSNRVKATLLELLNTPSITDEVTSSIRDHSTVLCQIVHNEFGLKYDAWFDNDAYHLGFLVGWMQRTQLNNNPFIDTYVTNGQLSTQGVQTSVRFDF